MPWYNRQALPLITPRIMNVSALLICNLNPMITGCRGESSPTPWCYAHYPENLQTTPARKSLTIPRPVQKKSGPEKVDIIHMIFMYSRTLSKNFPQRTVKTIWLYLLCDGWKATLLWSTPTGHNESLTANHINMPFIAVTEF